MSHLSLFNNRDWMCHVTVTVIVTIIKVIDTVKIIWITLMDLIEFNIKIMRKIKNTGKKHDQKKFKSNFD